MYTIQKLASLAGVSTRTLRWYDQKGLLKPGRNEENGYRLYGLAEVDRLQQILFYRALGVELAQIGAILDDPSFDRLEALRGHLTALQAERNRIDRLIDTVQQTITAEERKEIMSDEKKFEAFKHETLEEYAKTYEDESRAKYGDAEVDQMLSRFKGVTQEQYAEWDRLGKEILEKLSAAVTTGADPAGETGREIASLHHRWLTATGNQYDAQRHAGLADLYVQDERFTAYYDRETPGCAAFLSQAIHQWVKR